MSSIQAINLLKENGFIIHRRGKGDHLILRKNTHTIIIAHPKQELSSGMTKKVRNFARK